MTDESNENTFRHCFFHKVNIDFNDAVELYYLRTGSRLKCRPFTLRDRSTMEFNIRYTTDVVLLSITVVNSFRKYKSDRADCKIELYFRYRESSLNAEMLKNTKLDSL